MAFEQVNESFQWAPIASADLTGKLHYLVKMTGDNRVGLAAAGTDSVVGVIREEAIAERPVTVQFACIAKVILGATVVAGNRLTSDGSGKAIATTSAGDKVVGIALTGGDLNEIISMLMIPGHVAAS